MARVMITGSADGLGLMAARLLAEQGHEVTLHARDAARGSGLAALPRPGGGARRPVQHRRHSRVADQAQRSAATTPSSTTPASATASRERLRDRRRPGPRLRRQRARAVPADRADHRPAGSSTSVPACTGAATPTLATCSGSTAPLERRAGLLGQQAVRRWCSRSRSPAAGPRCSPTRVEPGWVPTKMGGPDAPDDLSQAAVTQAWLAVSDDPAATVTGRYFYHQRLRASSTRRPAATPCRISCWPAARRSAGPSCPRRGDRSGSRSAPGRADGVLLPDARLRARRRGPAAGDVAARLAGLRPVRPDPGLRCGPGCTGSPPTPA